MQRYYPYLAAAGALVAVSLLTYQLTRSPHHPGLQRSNATRRRRGSQHARRHQRVNPEPDPGGVLSDEQLLQNLNQEGGDLGTAPPLGIHIPESAAEALIDTGHAAQQARGARVGDSSVDGREGRAERRRNSIARSENSFSAETRENNENQNLLTLLYTIAQVRPPPPPDGSVF